MTGPTRVRHDSRRPTRRGEPGPTVVVAALAAIFALCIVSVRFAPPGSDVAAWWPAAGLGSALILLSRPSRWPVLLVGLVLVTGAANAVAGRPLGVSGLFGIANAAESLVVGLLLGATRGRPWLRTADDFRRMVVAGAAGAAVAGVLAAGAVVWALDGPFLDTARNVLASHAASELLIVPLALLLSDPRARVPAATGPAAMRGLQVVATMAAFILVHRVGQSLPLVFLPLPLLVWGAQILSLRALACEAIVVASIVTVLTAEGGGPFAVARISAPTIGALVQVELVVLVLVSLPLALANAQSRRAHESLAAMLADERNAVDRLEQLDRLKSDFLASVSHELRTPLTSILGFTQILGDGTLGPPTERQEKAIGRIDGSAQRLLGMVENLLLISRVESAEPTPTDRAPVELGAVVATAVRATARQRADRDLTLHVLPSAPVTVAADRGLLEQALTNLVTNAVKFTPDGGTVEVAVLAPQDDRAVIRISDDGVGIPADELERVFERFYRASTACTVDLQGSGLGLAIVRDIVDAHGGSVVLDSEVGRGTTVTISLPVGSAAP